MQNLGDLGANGGRRSKFLVKNVIFGIVDPDLFIHYWATMMIKGSLFLSTPTVKRFGKKTVPFWAII